MNSAHASGASRGTGPSSPPLESRTATIRLRITLGHRVLRVEVSDPRGERLPCPRPADQFGRGLLLIEALADRWGREPRFVGKTVYAEWDTAPGRPVLPYPERVEPGRSGGAL